VLSRALRWFSGKFVGGLESRAQSGQVLLWLLRGIFGAIIIGLGMVAFSYVSNHYDDPFNAYLAFFAILGVGFLVVLTDVMVRNKQITTISAIYFGLLLGMLLGNILSTALDPFIFEMEIAQPGTTQQQYKIYPARKGDDPQRKEEEGKEAAPKDEGGKDRGKELASKDEGGKDRAADIWYAEPLHNVPQGQRNVQNQRKALTILITVICCYISISTLLQTKDEFRFIIPYVEFSKQVKGGRPLVLDTSVIIDGRIADICDTRFIDTRMIVPRFVLQELQSVADSSDKLKRNRGRRGLDMLKRMQNNPKVELQINEANPPELRDIHKVDERLVVLAKALGARVVTNDYNLNKIAQLQGVEVINLNELANSLKSVALPGEVMNVRLVKPGDQLGQGVGYLEDGTMVVVEQGRSAIGQEVNITVTSVLQTPAGRMIFGRIEHRPHVPAGG
jgi:uncharacterized protein YacL